MVLPLTVVITLLLVTMQHLLRLHDQAVGLGDTCAQAILTGRNLVQVSFPTKGGPLFPRGAFGRPPTGMPLNYGLSVFQSSSSKPAVLTDNRFVVVLWEMESISRAFWARQFNALQRHNLLTIPDSNELSFCPRGILDTTGRLLDACTESEVHARPKCAGWEGRTLDRIPRDIHQRSPSLWLHKTDI